jgi:hypothetical protein
MEQINNKKLGWQDLNLLSFFLYFFTIMALLLNCILYILHNLPKELKLIKIKKWKFEKIKDINLSFLQLPTNQNGLLVLMKGFWLECTP